MLVQEQRAAQETIAENLTWGIVPLAGQEAGFVECPGNGRFLLVG